MPIKLPFGWWLCRDTTIPNDYPPKAREEMVQARLGGVEFASQAVKQRYDALMATQDAKRGGQ